MKRKQLKKRIICCILAVVMLLGAFPLHVIATEEVAPLRIMYNGEEISELLLVEDQKQTLTTATTVKTPLSYQWEILADAEHALWVKISGKTEYSCDVSMALVSSLLDTAGKAQLRCVATDGADTYTSAPVTVTISYNVEEDDLVESEARPPIMMMATAPGATGANNTTYTVTVYYLFAKDHSEAADPAISTFAAGEAAEVEVTSPVVPGYYPVQHVNGEPISATTVTIREEAISADIDVYVYYLPATVEFTVHHHFQNLNDDGYSPSPDKITTHYGKTGELVGDCSMTYLDDAMFTGFKALDYEQVTIGADGKTVVEIYYDREYYLVSFNLDGGFGVDPIYTRYGSQIKVDAPTYPGHTFSHWLLVGFAGSEPTQEQVNLYEIKDHDTVIEVHASMQYQAFWTTSSTTYTLVFWKENADNNDYTYWDYLHVPATSGDTVSAEDRVGEVAAITDEQMFLYNPGRSDHGKIVKGDGSTIVNVYYTRRTYTLTFNAPGYCTLEGEHTHDDSCYEYICGKEEHIHTEECKGVYSCGREEHLQHTPECLTCHLPIHTVHTADCLVCDKAVHTHTKACYDSTGYVGTEASGYSIYNAPKNPVQGQLYITRWGFNNLRRYIYLDGSWYNYQDPNLTVNDNETVLACPLGLEEHAHSEAGGCYGDVIHAEHGVYCYKDELHEHGDLCCEYAKDQHMHVNDPAADDTCLRLKCTDPEGHTHTDECRSASDQSTIKRVIRKYQAPLDDIWPIRADAPTVDGVPNNYVPPEYNEGERWDPADGNDAGLKDVLVFMAYMPGSDVEFTLSAGSGETYTMKYWLEKIPGQTLPADTQTTTLTSNNKTYYLWTTVTARYNYLTKAEDFFDIKGYTQYQSSPAFGSNNRLEMNNGGTVNMYYNLNVGDTLKLTFDNKSNTVEYSGESNGIIYGHSLKDYQYKKVGGAFTDEPYVPDYPTGVLEEGAYVFSGWFTSPDCVPGTEVDWDTLTMPDGALTLYAGWVPISYKIPVYLDKPTADSTPYHVFESVQHAHYLTLPEDKAVVAREGFEFMGWFYTDPKTNTEKAFNFNYVSIRDEIAIYARWRSITTVQYTIHYKLKVRDTDGNLLETDTKVAESFTGRTNAGLSKTFQAKAGTDLFGEYQSSYYPEVRSHTVQIGSSAAENEYTFWYVLQETVTYTVRYLFEDGTQAHAPKSVTGNFVVVTEFAERVDGYLPDATRKLLALTADPEQNVITFEYSTNTDNQAYFTVVYHVERLKAGEYDTLADFYEEKAIVGSALYLEPRVMTGFTLDTSKVVIEGGDYAEYSFSNGKLVPKSTLPADGLVINLYYTRNEVEYKVLFIQYGTNELIGDYSYMKTGRYGETLTVEYKDLEEYGYSLVGDQTVRTIELDIDIALNTVAFTYYEKQSAYSYNVVVYDGVRPVSSENIPAQTGTAKGSGDLAETYAVEHKLLGWYADAALTQPVVTPDGNGGFIWDEDVVDFNEATWAITPKKNANGVYTGGNYYAKVEMLYADLTIKVQGDATLDPDQRFILWISGQDGTHTEYVDQVVELRVNESITLTHVPVGNYQIVEADFWSWRYDLESDAAHTMVSVVPGVENTITYNHTNHCDHWCDGDGYAQIIFD